MRWSVLLLVLGAAQQLDTDSPAAIWAQGRLEDPAVARRLLPMLTGSGSATEAAAASAIAQSLKGFNPSTDPELMSAVADRLAFLARSPAIDVAIPSISPIGRLVYSTAPQVKAAEEALSTLLDRTGAFPQRQTARAAVARSLESLARLNPKLTSFDPVTVERLTRIVRKTSDNDTADVRRNALAALVSARAVDGEAEQAAVKDPDEQVRRIAMLVLADGGGGVQAASRAALIMEGLKDPSALVRYDALRAYIRRLAPDGGCGPIVSALSDESMHVVLGALDAFGDLCLQDENITTRLAVESRAPPTTGSWHRAAHAFVALAKRAPGKATASMAAFAAHPVWQVRMYAARAAAVMDDEPTLERLAYDANDNVRDAALEPLYKRRRADAMPALEAALKRSDYQLLRSAAVILKGCAHDHRLFAPLLDALTRVTKERKDTSRDTRLALLEAMAVHGEPADANTLEPLLADFDPKVAAAAAALSGRWTGRPVDAHPERVVRGGSVPRAHAGECVAVALKKGRTLHMTMLADAPLTADHFLNLALHDHYYDGLTFHRVVPAFVIQGGSPGANEYAGQKEFMRDEVGGRNERGTVGVSTRGRNTGDAQFFVNLVDNPRLDYDYTIFARVSDRDLPVLDGIQEGDEISGIRSVDCR